MNDTLRKARIFGIPMDLGQNRRGVDMGPSALRYAGLQEALHRLSFDCEDMGNVTVPQAEQPADPGDGQRPMLNAHYLPQVTRVCRETYASIRGCLGDDERGIFVGGDHSISIGTVAAIAQQQPVGVIWLDAHGDFNTPESSPSGNIHGMSLSALLGDGPRELAYVDPAFDTPVLRPEQIAMIGLRDIDPLERVRLASSGIRVYTMRDIDEQGISAIAAKVLTQFADLPHIHLSMDMDAFDPSIAPGVGTPVMGGLSYREAHLLMEILADTNKVRTVDVVEINPILDHHNQTAEMAVELLAGLFGKRIL